MSKTAMQELMFNIKESALLSGPAKTIVVAFIENHLRKERQQIIDAIVYGNGRAAIEDKNSLGEQYYNQTFNQ